MLSIKLFVCGILIIHIVEGKSLIKEDGHIKSPMKKNSSKEEIVKLLRTISKTGNEMDKSLARSLLANELAKDESNTNLADDSFNTHDKIVKTSVNNIEVLPSKQSDIYVNELMLNEKKETYLSSPPTRGEQLTDIYRIHSVQREQINVNTNDTFVNGPSTAQDNQIQTKKLNAFGKDKQDKGLNVEKINEQNEKDKINKEKEEYENKQDKEPNVKKINKQNRKEGMQKDKEESKQSDMHDNEHMLNAEKETDLNTPAAVNTSKEQSTDMYRIPSEQREQIDVNTNHTFVSGPNIAQDNQIQTKKLNAFGKDKQDKEFNVEKINEQNEKDKINKENEDKQDKEFNDEKTNEQNEKDKINKEKEEYENKQDKEPNVKKINKQNRKEGMQKDKEESKQSDMHHNEHMLNEEMETDLKQNRKEGIQKDKKEPKLSDMHDNDYMLYAEKETDMNTPAAVNTSKEQSTDMYRIPSEQREQIDGNTNHTFVSGPTIAQDNQIQTKKLNAFGKDKQDKEFNVEKINEQNEKDKLNKENEDKQDKEFNDEKTNEQNEKDKINKEKEEYENKQDKEPNVKKINKQNRKEGKQKDKEESKQSDMHHNEHMLNEEMETDLKQNRKEGIQKENTEDGEEKNDIHLENQNTEADNNLANIGVENPSDTSPVQDHTTYAAKSNNTSIGNPINTESENNVTIKPSDTVEVINKSVGIEKVEVSGSGTEFKSDSPKGQSNSDNSAETLLKPITAANDLESNQLSSSSNEDSQYQTPDILEMKSQKLTANPLKFQEFDHDSKDFAKVVTKTGSNKTINKALWTSTLEAESHTMTHDTEAEHMRSTTASFAKHATNKVDSNRLSKDTTREPKFDRKSDGINRVSKTIITTATFQREDQEMNDIEKEDERLGIDFNSKPPCDSISYGHYDQTAVVGAAIGGVFIGGFVVFALVYLKQKCRKYTNGDYRRVPIEYDFELNPRLKSHKF